MAFKRDCGLNIGTQLLTHLSGAALAIAIAIAAVALLFISSTWNGWLQWATGVETAFPPGEAARLVRGVGDYLRVDGPRALIEEARFTNPERHHLLELRSLWKQGERLLLSAGSVALIAGLMALYLAPYSWHLLAAGWGRSTSVTILLVAASVLLMIKLDFDGTFVALHQFFFSSFDWVFPADSTSIRLFPPNYFLFFAIGWSLALLLPAITLYVFTHRGADPRRQGGHSTLGFKFWTD